MNNTESSDSLLNHVKIGLIGNSTKCLVSFFGMLTNCFALIIFHRRNWLRQKQMLFFVASTVINLLSCITIFIPSIIFICLLKIQSGLSMRQITCLAYISPSALTNLISTRFALLIAGDRLLAQWYSFKWFRLPIYIKWLTIGIICFWSIFQVAFWFNFTDYTTIVPWCFWNDLDYPKNSLWQLVVEICSLSFTAVTLLFFFSVPLSAVCRPGKSFIKQINTECFIMHEQNIFLKNRETLARVRLLSFIYVAGFFCTLFIGSALGETAAFRYANGQSKSSVYLSSLSDLLMNIHFTFTPFIFLLDASFRRELRRFFHMYRL